jgi:hypothetical protein
MYNILQSAHSGMRWLTLILLVVAVGNGLSKWLSKSEFTGTDRKINLFALIFTHIQVLIGLVLYFISPRVNFDGEVMADAVTRFFVIEHPLTMIIAAVLITIGNSRSKKMEGSENKFKSTAIFYGVGLLLILSRIPWPFQDLGAGWF